jgi:hypothetical protein
MSMEFDDSENFSPYDLGAIGRMREREKGVREAKREAARREVQRRIKLAESMGDGVNPYDLGQMAYIFEPLKVLDHPRF